MKPVLPFAYTFLIQLISRHWSMNIGIGFHTPEEFFLNKPGKEMLHRFDPSTHLDNNAVENKDADR